MSLLVPAYPGCPGSKAVKRSLLLLLLLPVCLNINSPSTLHFSFKPPYARPQKTVEGAHFTGSAPGAENPSYAIGLIV